MTDMTWKTLKEGTQFFEMKQQRTYNKNALIVVPSVD